MKVLILSHEKDNHAVPIRWALEQARCEVACWDGLSWTEQQQASLLLEEYPTAFLGPHAVEPGDTIWIRQYSPPLPHPRAAEAGHKTAGREYSAFYDCILYFVDSLPVRCINRFSASRWIENKAVQLRLAQACGLNVPPTLMSNRPDAVRTFFEHRPRRIICKPFTPHSWQGQKDDGIALTGTFELTREQLPADEVLTFAPGIYQEMVAEKQFDVRMVLMDRRLYSYALHTPTRALDWRLEGAIQVEIITTPPDVESAILTFAAMAGVCFGSIDFAVDSTGKWWFLEINEQGQFLWLDHLRPEGRIQEKFCAFITTPEGSTRSLEEREGLFPSFSEYQKSGAAQEPQRFNPPGPRSLQMSFEP